MGKPATAQENFAFAPTSAFWWTGVTRTLKGAESEKRRRRMKNNSRYVLLKEVAKGTFSRIINSQKQLEFSDRK
jgi:hypothetical protein